MTDQTVQTVRSVDVLDASGAKAGSADLPADVFDVQTNVPLIHQVVVAQLAAARQGTHSTKTRGEVRGGGRKPYKQKGTGRARQGSTRAPQFAGGGTVHGPQPRDYSQRTPKKMKAAALRGALSDRARAGRVHVVSSLVEGEAPKTKAALTALRNVVAERSALVVLERTDELTVLSLRNVPERAPALGRPAEHLRRPRQRRRRVHRRRAGRLRRRRRRGGDQVSIEASKNPRDIIFKPIVSEKSYGLIDEGKYTFEVDPRSNKTEIKNAIEKIFDVKVASVNTANRQGKSRRTKFGLGKRKDTKRAIVTLREGSIDIFGEVAG